ncbi:MAG TPA: LysR substrate-binding domain-containing protein [Usitatibacter sp.]|nr:LysR substrate-binding domain-containing protein [Usitatibacter sp.]
MRLSLETLQVVDAIDRRGSFAAAAAELHRVPSAITYSVRQLEENLGVAVFDRRGRRAVLTAAGRELLDEGRRLLRAAADLECRVQQVASGWEAELRLALDTVIAIEHVLPLVAELYAQHRGTRVRILHEVLGGTWDALASGRADLAIGAPGDAPAGRNYSIRTIGRASLAFVAAPSHPICGEPLPLADEAILAHRAVSIADTSRMLEPRTMGLLWGQDTLAVPSMQAKVAAHVAGLGVGFVPGWIAAREAAAGRLRILPVAAERAPVELVVAWRPGKEGKALRWMVKRLEDRRVAAGLLS